MTKKVRIENADTTSYKVVVEVWDKGAQIPDGMGASTKPPTPWRKPSTQQTDHDDRR